MKYLYVFVVLILCITCQNQTKKSPKNNDSSKPLTDAESSRKQVTQVFFNNPDSVDWTLYGEDLADFDKIWTNNLPIGALPFPVEKYHTPGAGIGNMIDTINRKQLAGKFLTIGQEKAFFNILVKTDQKDPLSYSEISSRNHPHYLGQGSILHPKWTVDWLAIKPQKGEGYAIVSGRIFDLSQGKTIFVYEEEKEGGIEFLQIDETVAQMNKTSIADFFSKISKKKKILEILSRR
jgi:hypothetical protein